MVFQITLSWHPPPTRRLRAPRQRPFPGRTKMPSTAFVHPRAGQTKPSQRAFDTPNPLPLCTHGDGVWTDLVGPASRVRMRMTSAWAPIMCPLCFVVTSSGSNRRTGGSAGNAPKAAKFYSCDVHFGPPRSPPR
ncbi:hypothetical protein B296_00001898 [Ensete ventricosum]|uniref:Uncharacterized protein n=1 Tax=Ensete ventricosum TaxID=4639 RepID=A0A427BBC8_ENSVE|nr:hypothetical protein B296_00001898 [Ensete ventricosum]